MFCKKRKKKLLPLPGFDPCILVIIMAVPNPAQALPENKTTIKEAAT